MNHVSEDDHEHALNSRVLIEQAEGVLARVHGVDVDAAFALLRGCARSHNRKLVDLARLVLAAAGCPI
jgi:AmiR/NasT family two-component response regulator